MATQEKDDVEQLEPALIVKAMLGGVTDEDIEHLGRAQGGRREQ